MRYPGRVFKVDDYWAIEVPILGIVTQGKTREEAFEMITDAVEALVAKKGFVINVFLGEDDYFEIGSKDSSTLNAFMLRRLRLRNNLTLKEVSKRMGAKSINAYARYEQGLSVPTINKLGVLIAAINQDQDFVLSESRL